MKFHGHDYLDGTPEEISEFDPFHIHKKKDSFDTQAAFREKDTKYQCLQSVLFFN